MKKKQKLNILKRDNYKCGIHLGGCGKKLSLDSMTIDHIVPKNILKGCKEYKKQFKKYKFIDNEFFNLQPMCLECKSKKQGNFPPNNIVKNVLINVAILFILNMKKRVNII